MKPRIAALLCLALLAPQAGAARVRIKPRTKKAAPARKAPPIVPLHPPRVSTEPITFVWPPEGLVLDAPAEFVFGNVADPKARFTINGQTVTVHKDGGFLAWLPITPGTMTFHAELALATAAVAERSIFVPPPPTPLPDGVLAIDPASLLPAKGDFELRPGDWWTARMKATRGKRARFRVGNGPWRAMRETNPSLGIYEAVQQVASDEEFGPAPIEYEIGSGWSSTRLKGAASVSATRQSPAVAVVRPTSVGYVNVKTGPSNGFLLFPQPGTRFLTAGRENGSVRVLLRPNLVGWVDAKDVELSTGVTPPRAVTGNIGVTAGPLGTAVRISLSERIPFEVVENDRLDGLTLRLYSTVGHTNTIIYEGDADFVDQVRWRQQPGDVVEVAVILKPGLRLWGYNARYDNGSSLRLDLRHPPRIDPKEPLAGLKVMLDPGHMPSAPGAIGPLGTREMDANFAIAQAVAERLTREGATPLLTRGTTSQEVSLTDRPKLALERGADLFVSLHNNALPDGSNPFAKPRGFTVFYYHPHSLELGRAVHASFQERVTLPDEGLQWGNLLVARLSAVPAILVENAYMMLPEQEALLNDPAFRDALAKAVVAGLKSFVAGAGEKRHKP